MQSVPHLSVLFNEIIHALAPRPGGRYADGTLGAGGHALGILQASAPNGEVLGLDLDPQARAIASQRLAQFGERVHIVAASYQQLDEEMHRLGWSELDGIVLDLGVSSMQLDTPERGFSFLHDAPLDMRFSPQNTLSAHTLVNDWDERELADVIYRYGEERDSRKIARAIVRSRPIHTTRALASVIEGISPRRGDRQHPATRIFQALRIAVNDELGALEKTLPMAISTLKPGGRLAVISFHSLEDRLVKTFFRHESRDCICPPRVPVCTCGHRAILKEVTHKPIMPSAAEVEANARARSARLRVAERL
jgi:16S rRNA (cytosine1402-N4)-methyltransferase